MDYNAEYARWLDNAENDADRRELMELKANEAEIIERFGTALEFGTAGLRGIMGAGTARMNLSNVRRATQGLADYLLSGRDKAAVAIAYDSRNQSDLFAKESASVLAANGVTAYIYDRLMPVPLLSFAVREIGTNAGIMITASHNPAAYNGYKVYGSDGCQMSLDDTKSVYACIQKIDAFTDVKRVDFETGIADGTIRYIENSVVARYYEEAEAQQVNPGICVQYPIKVLYSPLHGSGNEPVRRVLADIGISDVVVVPQQELPNGDFPTCPYPNPETKEALALGLELCESVKPDLFIATDPDADRVGVAFRQENGYTILTGNEVGALLLHYIIESRTARGTMPENPIAVRSIVSTALADDIAQAGGVRMITVLTGFKFIGEQILLLEQKGEADRFIFGFEESCGYLAGSHVRDKDAVIACMLLCEMTSYYKSKGTTPFSVLQKIYEIYGYYRNEVLNIQFEGAAGSAEMRAVMESLFARHPAHIGGYAVASVEDYRNGVRENKATGTKETIDLPSAEVIAFTLENGASVIVRPSGTEPKMKVYITVKENTADASAALAEKLAAAARHLIKQDAV